MVLVGNEKTLKDSEMLLQEGQEDQAQVPEPDAFDLHWRQGLATAHADDQSLCAGPGAVPVEGRPARREAQRRARYSVFRCPGRYTLQVAEFAGRSTFNVDDKRVQATRTLVKDSPLEQAYDNAEKLAEVLAKDPEIRRRDVCPTSTTTGRRAG